MGYSNAQEYITAFTTGVTEQQENLKENLAIFDKSSLSEYAKNADAGSVNNLANQTTTDIAKFLEKFNSYKAASLYADISKINTTDVDT